MIKINLLSEGRRTSPVRPKGGSSKDRDWAVLVLAASLVVAILLLGTYWFMLRSELGAAEEEVRVAQQEVDRLAPILKEVEEFEAKQGDLENKIRIITDLKNNQTGPVRVMDAVATALPELLWLDSMDVTNRTIALSGRAFNYSAISNFIENLDKVPEFREPKLQRASRTGAIHPFTISIEYSLTPPSTDDDLLAEDTLAEGGPDAGGGPSVTVLGR